MSASWNTKYGPRRVRRDPPTLAEAITAAQGLCDDREQQAEIAAGLMGVPLAEVLSEMKKLGFDRSVQTTTITAAGDRSAPRMVVVERKASRRFVVAPGRPPVPRPSILSQRGR